MFVTIYLEKSSSAGGTEPAKEEILPESVSSNRFSNSKLLNLLPTQEYI